MIALSENPYEPSKTASDLTLSDPALPGCTSIIAFGQILSGLVLGFGIWAATAPKEAWDANPFYSVLVFVAGVAASFGRWPGFYWGIPGVYLGQLIAIHMLIPAGRVPIFPAFAAVLMFGTLPAAVGALVGGAIGSGVTASRRKASIDKGIFD